MNEQEITQLLDNVRQGKPRPSNPQLSEALVGGYLRYRRTMKGLRTLVSCLTLAAITMAATVLIPNPRYGFVDGAMAATPTAACRQIETILSLA